jgi:hypothetical protein
MRRWTLVTIALIAALCLPAAAAADTVEIGSASPTNFPSDSGCGGCHSLQVSTAPGAASYVVPAAPAGGGWTLTSWSARGGVAIGTGSVEVWRPTATANQYRLIAIGPEDSFPANTVTTHAVSIPVLPGDHLGILTLTGEFSPAYDTTSDADLELGVSGNPAVGQTVGAPTSDFLAFKEDRSRVNAGATLTAPSTPATGTAKKCKKKKHKRSAASAKKKKCKKRKKR